MASSVMDERSPLLSVQGDGSWNLSDASDSEVGDTDHRPETLDRKLRKPFHHDTLRRPSRNSQDLHTAAMYQRYKYLSKLSGHSKEMIIPDHILPPSLFLVLAPKSPQEKQSSIVTIFAIWNTMMGTSLLSVPWAISQAGFSLGILLMIVMAFICLYTCYLIIKSAEEPMRKGKVVEFADICKTHLGRYGEFAAVLFSLVAIIGATIVFWVLMSNFLYNSGKFIHETQNNAYHLSTNSSLTNKIEVLCPTGPTAGTSSEDSVTKADKSHFFKYWSQQKSVPLFLIVILFPLCSIKSPTFFTKFNSLGTLSVLYIVTFTIVKGAKWGIHMEPQNGDPIPEFSIGFPALTGTMSLAMFIHSCILSIVRNQEKPENNKRDLTIAYILVTITYLLVGALFYMAFPREKSCIHQVFLDNLPPSDVMTFIARLGLLFQLVTVFPLVVYIIRVQFMLYFFKQIYPSFVHVMVMNILLVGVCVIFACFYPHVGNIIRYSGATSGLAYIFTLPCLVFMVIQRKKGELTWPSAVFHSFLVFLGILNFIGQILISL